MLQRPGVTKQCILVFVLQEMFEKNVPKNHLNVINMLFYLQFTVQHCQYHLCQM